MTPVKRKSPQPTGALETAQAIEITDATTQAEAVQVMQTMLVLWQELNAEAAELKDAIAVIETKLKEYDEEDLI